MKALAHLQAAFAWTRNPLGAVGLSLVGCVAACAQPERDRAGYEEAFSERQALVLQLARERLLGTGMWDITSDPPVNTSVNDVGKHWWPRIFAELAAHPDGTTLIRQRDGTAIAVRQLIRGLIHNAPDNRPGLNNPAIGYLYFSPVGLGWVLHAFPGLVTEADLAVLFEKTIRYEPTLSALNMFTGQGTENHMLMGRTGGYLICQAVVARGRDDPISGHLHGEAAAWLARLREYFIETARATYDRGFGEWDSSIYYPYVAACWLGMREFAADPAVRSAAQAVLDWMAATVALRCTAGVFGGTEQRSALPLRSGESNLDHLAWLWWGGMPGHRVPDLQRQDFSQVVYACLSAYRPAEAIRALALKQLSPNDFGRLHFETKPSYLTHGEASVRQQTRVLFQIDRDYTLGAAIARPTGGWTAGDNQDLLWKLVLNPTAGADSAFVVAGAKGRDPWRQVGMWKNLLIDLWHLPADAEALKAEAMGIIDDWRRRRGLSLARTFPGDTSRENTVRAREVSTAHVRAALVFSDGREVALPADGSPLCVEIMQARLAIRAVGRGLASLGPGEFGGFIIEVASAADHPGIEAFRAAVAARDTAHPPFIDGGSIEIATLAGDRVEFAFETSGAFVEPEFDWGYGADREGGYVIMSMPPFEFPDWPEGEGHGRVPRLTIDGKPIETWFDASTYRGPNLNLQGGILTVRAGGREHRLDLAKILGDASP